jgi:hypothetical protein
LAWTKVFGIVDVLAADHYGRVVYALNHEDYITRSNDYGVTWESSYAVERRYLDYVQMDTEYSHAVSEFQDQDPADQEVPKISEMTFVGEEGEAWYVSKKGVYGYTADRAHTYFSAWNGGAGSTHTINICPDECKGVDCGDFGRCAAGTGLCKCYEGWTGDQCQTPPAY